MRTHVALPPISGECVVTNIEPLSPVVGQPNPELERGTSLQKILIAVIVVGFFVLMAYLPNVAMPLK
jgi:hypothetical protein